MFSEEGVTGAYFTRRDVAYRCPVVSRWLQRAENGLRKVDKAYPEPLLALDTNRILV